MSDPAHSLTARGRRPGGVGPMWEREMQARARARGVQVRARGVKCRHARETECSASVYPDIRALALLVKKTNSCRGFNL
jgi:hypothetical protein